MLRSFYKFTTSTVYISLLGVLGWFAMAIAAEPPNMGTNSKDSIPLPVASENIKNQILPDQLIVAPPEPGFEPAVDQNTTDFIDPLHTTPPFSSLSELPKAKWNFTAEHMPAWQEILPGLQLIELAAKDGLEQAIGMTILRIDPNHYDFNVLTVQHPDESLSLQGWQAKYNLVAVINASMYLPDQVTSTGFLRSGELVNNPRIVNKFGAFFLARPIEHNKPGALLLDRTEDNWQDQLTQYQDVVQNYRLISASRKLLWATSETRHSIAAVGRDGQERILFIHSKSPVRGVDFGSLLLDLPIDIRLVMYTEGGSQAGMLLHTPRVQKTWLGQLSLDFGVISNLRGAPLPSVIGLKPKRGKYE